MKPCRVCRVLLQREPMIRLHNMPRGAQCLPCREDLASDRGIDLEVFQCEGCGLVQLTTPPVPYYREVIRATAFSPEMQEFRLRQFRKFVTTHGLVDRKVLEVGCGRGEYLSLLAANGTLAYGIEQGEEAVAAARAAGLQVTHGFLETPEQVLPEAPFDGFMILNFLEHIPEPVTLLRSIAAQLRPGAPGLVEVPNFDLILRQHLFSEFIPDHLLYFTKETLHTTLSLGGFELIGCEEVWHRYILSATVKKRVMHDPAGFHHRLQGYASEVWAFLRKFPARQVAVWGAGHQALALITLLGVASHLAYVVDSAPFKQGRFTPATHLPIFPPDRLRSDPVAAVLVMAASYSDEVVRLLREEFPAELAIAVIRERGLEVVTI